MSKTNTMSQRSAKEKLGDPEAFQGGCVVTKNGVAELYIQTAEERQQEEQLLHAERQANALLKLAVMAKEDAINGRVHTKEAVLKRLRSART